MANQLTAEGRKAQAEIRATEEALRLLATINSHTPARKIRALGYYLVHNMFQPEDESVLTQGERDVLCRFHKALVDMK